MTDRSKPRYEAVYDNTMDQWIVIAGGSEWITERFGMHCEADAKDFAAHCNAWGHNGWPLVDRVERRNPNAQAGARYRTNGRVIIDTKLGDGIATALIGTRDLTYACMIADALNAAEALDPSGWRVRDAKNERRGRKLPEGAYAWCEHCGGPVFSYNPTGCPSCGSPNCCPKCCDEAALENEPASDEKRMREIFEAHGGKVYICTPNHPLMFRAWVLGVHGAWFDTELAAIQSCLEAAKLWPEAQEPDSDDEPEDDIHCPKCGTICDSCAMDELERKHQSDAEAEARFAKTLSARVTENFSEPDESRRWVASWVTGPCWRKYAYAATRIEAIKAALKAAEEGKHE